MFECNNENALCKLVEKLSDYIKKANVPLCNL